jgi:hypothetical protein
MSKDPRVSLRWLLFSVPEDSLLAGCWTYGHRPTKISLVSRPLREAMKREGFAETHLHLGAALSFSDLWLATMRELTKPEMTRTTFMGTGGEFSQGRDLAGWLIRAAIARLLLGYFISQAESTCFAVFIKKNIFPWVQDRLGVGARVCLQHSLFELTKGRFFFDVAINDDYLFRTLQIVYQALSGAWISIAPREDENIQAFRMRDPLASKFSGDLSGFQHIETMFQSRIFDLLSSARLRKRSDQGIPLLSSLFWQYFRVRCIYYRHVVQRPLTPGLQWFLPTYRRLKPGRGSISFVAQLESALDLSGDKQGLRSLEVRTSFFSEPSLYRQLGIAIRELILSRSSTVEIGVVFHFVRRPDPIVQACDRKIDARADLDIGTFRYSEFAEDIARQANGLIQELRNSPECLNWIRGIDACTDENAIPNWVLFPTMRRLKQESEMVVSKHNFRHGTALHPLHVTIHVGEDFLSPMTGLRHIGEALQFLGLGTNDRLGHAMALGLDIKCYAVRMGRVAIPTEERLWDLVWERTLYGGRLIKDNSGRLAFVDEEIARLLRRMLGNSVPDLQVSVTKLYEAFYSVDRLQNVGFPRSALGSLSERRKDEIDDVMRELLVNRDVISRGREPIWVDLEPEIESCITVQSYLLKACSRRGLVVEVNPSSNLHIGGLSADLSDHPVVQLVRRSGESDSIPVVIGSDDPLTMACKLPEEHSLIMDALFAAGLDTIRVKSLMSLMREASLDHRFTVSVH